MAELIALRQEDEALQAEAEARLAVEQAARAEEDARLRELYPLPEDDEEYAGDGYTYQGAGDQAGDDSAQEPVDAEVESSESPIDGETAAEPPSHEADAEADPASEDGAPGQEGTR